jgi:hypothetical protein
MHVKQTAAAALHIAAQTLASTSKGRIACADHMQLTTFPLGSTLPLHCTNYNRFIHTPEYFLVDAARTGGNSVN